MYCYQGIFLVGLCLGGVVALIYLVIAGGAAFAKVLQEHSDNRDMKINAGGDLLPQQSDFI